MPTFRRIGSSFVNIPRIIRRIGGVFRPILTISRRVAGTWRLVYNAYDNFNPTTNVTYTGPVNKSYTLTLNPDGTLRQRLIVSGSSVIFDSTISYTKYTGGVHGEVATVAAKTYCVVTVPSNSGMSITNNAGGHWLNAARSIVLNGADAVAVVNIKLYAEGVTLVADKTITVNYTF